jgi:hypothetical protein
MKGYDDEEENKTKRKKERDLWEHGFIHGHDGEMIGGIHALI